ncbi:MAG TPA: cupin domain-containing protein, partial [Phenylobacterium sp.]|nr:cupin domain-containing protein [Phenylobacterium sp.]
MHSNGPASALDPLRTFSGGSAAPTLDASTCRFSYPQSRWIDHRSIHSIEGEEDVIRKAMLAALGLLWSASAVAQPAAPQAGGVFPMHTMAEGVWVEYLVGDPEVPDAEFVIRIHHDPGYVVLPHTHPRTENITVLSGEWALGMGARFDRSRLVAMPQGALGVVSPKMAHFGYAKVETILQVHGIGPFVNLPV